MGRADRRRERPVERLETARLVVHEESDDGAGRSSERSEPGAAKAGEGVGAILVDLVGRGESGQQPGAIPPGRERGGERARDDEREEARALVADEPSVLLLYSDRVKSDDVDEVRIRGDPDNDGDVLAEAGIAGREEGE